MAELKITGLHLSGRWLRRAELLRRDGRIEILRLEGVPFTGESDAPAPAVVPAPAPSLNGSRSVAAMPAVDVMSRCWLLPQAAENTLRQLVIHRLEADLPLPIDQITWGYRRVSEPTAGNECAVLAQAVRTDRAAEFVSRLAASGWHVDLLTTEAEALASLYREGLSPAGMGTEALLLAGPDEWLLCVLSGGLAHAIRRIRVDAKDPAPACRECDQFLASQRLSPGVSRIRLCAAAGEVDLPPLLAEVCGLPVETVEACDKLTLAGGEPLSGAQLAEFGPAIGLALAWMSGERERVIRLAGRAMPGAAESPRGLSGLLARTWLWTSAAAALLIVATVIHVLALRAETQAMRDALARGSASAAALDALKPQIRAMQRLEQYRIDVEAIFTDICTAIKDPITLSSVQLSRERRLVIKGKAQDPKAIFTFADDLRGSARLKHVNLERTAPGQGGDFVISAEPVGFEKLATAGLRGVR